MQVRKGQYLKATKDTKYTEAGQLMRVARGGKRPKLIHDYNPETRNYSTVEMPKEMLDGLFEPTTVQSKYEIINQIDLSNIKFGPGHDEFTKTISGHVAYKGHKLEVCNRGWGGPTNITGDAEIIKEIDQLMQEQIPYTQDWFKPRLDFLVDFASEEPYGLVDLDEEFDVEPI